jgi:hypothetical protein
MSLLPFFQWCEATPLGDAIRESQWLFPVIESVHLIGLVFVAATVLLVDMRLLGLGLRDQPVSRLARGVQPYLLASVVVMIITGTLLFVSEAIKCYYSPAFWVKITCLAVVIVYTFTIRKRVVVMDETRGGPALRKAVAIVSILLWAGVGWGGRWIGFGG